MSMWQVIQRSILHGVYSRHGSWSTGLAKVRARRRIPPSAEVWYVAACVARLHAQRPKCSLAWLSILRTLNQRIGLTQTGRTSEIMAIKWSVQSPCPDQARMFTRLPDHVKRQWFAVGKVVVPSSILRHLCASIHKAGVKVQLPYTFRSALGVSCLSLVSSQLNRRVGRRSKTANLKP